MHNRGVGTESFAPESIPENDFGRSTRLLFFLQKRPPCRRRDAQRSKKPLRDAETFDRERLAL